MWLIKHLRHSRGYGVHSPLLYRIVREAMMPRKIAGTEHALYDALRAQGICKHTATRLQNLYSLEGYEAWRVDQTAKAEGELMIATAKCEEQIVASMANALREHEGAVCIIHSPRNRQLRKSLITAHPSMSAANCQLTLLWWRKDLRKQHIII